MSCPKWIAAMMERLKKHPPTEQQVDTQMKASARVSRALNHRIPGKCKRCRMLENLNLNYLCANCVVELLEGKPNMHGEGPLKEKDDNGKW